MATRQVTFYYDIISHNAYLALHGLDRIAARHDLSVSLRPVLFGAMLKHYGQLGPAEIAPKNRWMVRDVLRKARELQLPLNPPACHPFNPLWALRCLLTQPDDGARRTLTDVLFRAVWVDGRNVSDADELESVLATAGHDAAAMLTQAAQPAIKSALREATQTAIDDGVFGVPSMALDGQIYWGFDDLPVLEDVLVNGDPIDAQALVAWQRVKPGVVRKR